MKVIKTEQSKEIFKGITHLGDVAEIERNIAEAKGNIQVEQSNPLAFLTVSAFQEVISWRYQQPTAPHVPQPERRDTKSPALVVQHRKPRRLVRGIP